MFFSFAWEEKPQELSLSFLNVFEKYFDCYLVLNFLDKGVRRWVRIDKLFVDFRGNIHVHYLIWYKNYRMEYREATFPKFNFDNFREAARSVRRRDYLRRAGEYYLFWSYFIGLL